MKLKDYWKKLDEKGREAFASRAGTTVLTIDRKYLNSINIPRRSKLTQLIEATNGAVSRDEMLNHFYPPAEQGAA